MQRNMNDQPSTSECELIEALIEENKVHLDTIRDTSHVLTESLSRIQQLTKENAELRSQIEQLLKRVEGSIDAK